MGLNFYYYDGLQPKMSAGIINEHECSCSCWEVIRLSSGRRRQAVAVGILIQNVTFTGANVVLRTLTIKCLLKNQRKCCLS